MLRLSYYIAVFIHCYMWAQDHKNPYETLVTAVILKMYTKYDSQYYEKHGK